MFTKFRIGKKFYKQKTSKQILEERFIQEIFVDSVIELQQKDDDNNHISELLKIAGFPDNQILRNKDNDETHA